MAKRKDSSLRHVRLYHWMQRPPAWQSLSVVARSQYVELSSRFHGTNNGEIIFSVRQAAKALHVSKDTAARAFDHLQARGFTAVRRKGGFNLKERKGQATEWRLTEHPYVTDAVGTKDFTRWPDSGDFAIARGPKPNNKTKPAKREHSPASSPIPLANYKRPTKRTVERKIRPVESQGRDQNVAFPQHESQYKDRTVPVAGLEVSSKGPSSKSSAQTEDVDALPTVFERLGTR